MFLKLHKTFKLGVGFVALGKFRVVKMMASL